MDDQTREAGIHLAWLMWCYEQGYTKAEDRAITRNWMRDELVTAEDAEARSNLLAMADEVLALVAAENDTLRANLLETAAMAWTFGFTACQRGGMATDNPYRAALDGAT